MTKTHFRVFSDCWRASLSRELHGLWIRLHPSQWCSFNPASMQCARTGVRIVAQLRLMFNVVWRRGLNNYNVTKYGLFFNFHQKIMVNPLSEVFFFRIKVENPLQLSLRGERNKTSQYHQIAFTCGCNALDTIQRLQIFKVSKSKCINSSW